MGPVAVVNDGRKTPSAPVETLWGDQPPAAAGRPEQNVSTDAPPVPDAPQSSLRRARNATVFIQTPWGSGSGFLVDDSGHLVTNRHVVEYPPDKMADLRARIDQLESALKQEKGNLAQFRSDLQQVADADRRRRYQAQLDRRQANYDKYRRVLDEMLTRRRRLLEYLVQYDVAVVLADGSRFGVVDYELSDSSDLALLSLDGAPPATPPVIVSDAVPDQGTPVYAIGNPAGLRDTVTSGIVSGYRSYQGFRLIQTDAAINPGNSGGPLTDSDGRVLGVNSMILGNTEGIGFALPISAVREAFPRIFPN
ncbi:hypothetical protein C2E25_10535 [Geothermobacter hydrogeniphilus]|uniref:Trypsin-like peptidase domain-containing protein n=2 Tax=Geothermobacter hydrogeniphilus TaxID=1969733 RepID=A0A2K2H9H3_9BACT|nr:hypothetical protein C2E25_10535 [Geothermobacter hydrogeniphilus]